VTEEPFVNVVIRTVDSETCLLDPVYKLVFYEGLGKKLVKLKFFRLYDKRRTKSKSKRGLSSENIVATFHNVEEHHWGFFNEPIANHKSIVMKLFSHQTSRYLEKLSFILKVYQRMAQTTGQAFAKSLG